MKICHPTPWRYNARVQDGDVWAELELRALDGLGLGGRWQLRVFRGNASGRPLGRRQAQRAIALIERALPEFKQALQDAGWTEVDEPPYAGARPGYWIAPANES